MTANPKPNETWRDRKGEGPKAAVSLYAAKEQGRGSLIRVNKAGHSYPNTTQWEAEKRLRDVKPQTSNEENKRVMNELKIKHNLGSDQVSAYEKHTNETPAYLLKQLTEGRLHRSDVLRQIVSSGLRGR